MATITTRSGKGSPLTNTEVDDNFTNLNTAKYESGDDIAAGSVSIAIGNNHLKINRQGSDSNGLYWERVGTQDAAIRVQNNEQLTIDNNFGNPIKLRIGAVGAEAEKVVIANSEIAINESSADTDFRVESVNNTAAIFLNAGTDQLGLFTASLGSRGKVTISGSAAYDYVQPDGRMLWVGSDNTGAGTRSSLIIGNGSYSTGGNQYATIGLHPSHGNADYTTGFDIEVDRTNDGPAHASFSIVRSRRSANSGRSLNTPFKIIGSGSPAVVINDDSTDYTDFRVESDSTANMLFVDAGDNRVSIGGTPQEAQFTVQGSTSFISGTYYRNAQYSVPTATWVDVYWTDNTTTLDRGYAYEFTCVTTGTGTDTGSKYLVWWGSNNTWNIRESGRSGFGSNHPKGRVDNSTFQIATDHGSTYSVRVNSKATLHGNGEIDSSYFGPEALMRVSYGSNLDVYGKTRFHTGGSTPDVTTDTYNKGIELTGGNMRLNIDVSNVVNGGSYIQTRHQSVTYPEAFYALNLNPLGGTVVVNNEGADNGDFRVESDSNDHMLFVDAGEDMVGIGTPSPTAPLTVNGRGVDFGRRAAGQSTEGRYLMIEGAAQSDGEAYGRIMFTEHNSSSVAADSYGFSIHYDGVGTTNEFPSGFSPNTTNAQWQFRGHDGSLQGLPIITGSRSSQGITVHGGMNVNEDSLNWDFRVESDSNTHAIFLDASASTVAFGRSSFGELNTSPAGYSFHHAGGACYAVGVQSSTNTSNYLNYWTRNATSGGMVYMRSSGNDVGSITNSTTGVTYNTTSDRRLKDNIQPIADATDKLMAMNPVTHTWIADPEAPAVNGFIAQEMQEIVPEAVTGDPTGEEMMSMDYGRITPVLVAALQDAHKKIAELEARLNELEGK